MPWVPPLTYAVRDLSVPGPLLIWVVLPSRSKERVVTLSGVSRLEVVRTCLTSGHAVIFVAMLYFALFRAMTHVMTPAMTQKKALNSLKYS